MTPKPSNAKHAATYRAKQAARVKAMREALQAIVNGDVPRERSSKYLTDGTPSKIDQCGHSRYLYEDCSGCLEEFAAQALAPQGEK